MSKKSNSRGRRALLQSLEELESMVREGLTLEDFKARYPDRVRVVAPEPGKHTPAGVKALRKKMGASQRDFANLVGVSRILVQSWERGVRDPSPLARRLLDVISADPAGWLASLGHAPKGSRRAG